MAVNKNPNWVTSGKTISQLIEELKSFSDQNLEVRLSLDDGESFKPISLVVRKGGLANTFVGWLTVSQTS